MSDNIELGVILRNTADAARDARASLEASDRFITAFGPRLKALESRFASLEERTAGIEKTLDENSRALARIEATLATISAAVTH